MTTPATELADVNKFRFGGPVHTDDGELGSLAYVAADPQSQTLAALGVKFGLFGRDYMVPIDQLVEATPANIRLKLTRAQVEQVKEKPDGPALKDGTAVTLNGKRIGKLAQLTTNAQTHALRHLVVDRAFGPAVLAPARAISKIESRQVDLTMPGMTAEQLTPYRDDDELREEIRIAIEEAPRLSVDLPGMDIRVIDGVVWLEGHCASDLSRQLTFEQVQGIRGINELLNHLISDQALAARVSSTLAHAPRIGGPAHRRVSAAGARLPAWARHLERRPDSSRRGRQDGPRRGGPAQRVDRRPTDEGDPRAGWSDQQRRSGSRRAVRGMLAFARRIGLRARPVSPLHLVRR